MSWFERLAAFGKIRKGAKAASTFYYGVQVSKCLFYTLCPDAIILFQAASGQGQRSELRKYYEPTQPNQPIQAIQLTQPVQSTQSVENFIREARRRSLQA
jgi:hypothetical protein